MAAIMVNEMEPLFKDLMSESDILLMKLLGLDKPVAILNQIYKSKLKSKIIVKVYRCFY